MKTSKFFDKNDFPEFVEWAAEIGKEMKEIWPALVEQGRLVWLSRIACDERIFTEPARRKLACRLLRETSLRDGRKVWDSLEEDEESRKLVDTIEQYADGAVPWQTLKIAYLLACDRFDHRSKEDRESLNGCIKLAALHAGNLPDVTLGSVFYHLYKHDEIVDLSSMVAIVASLGNPFLKPLPPLKWRPAR